MHCYLVTGESQNDITLVTGESHNDVTPVVVKEQKHDGRKSGKRKHRGTDSTVGHCPQDSLWTVFSDLCGFLRQSLALYMQHIYASHVIRAVLQVLSAQPIDDVILHGRQRGIRQQQSGRTDAGYSQHYATYIFRYAVVHKNLPAYI